MTPSDIQLHSLTREQEARLVIAPNNRFSLLLYLAVLKSTLPGWHHVEEWTSRLPEKVWNFLVFYLWVPLLAIGNPIKYQEIKLCSHRSNYGDVRYSCNIYGAVGCVENAMAEDSHLSIRICVDDG